LCPLCPLGQKSVQMQHANQPHHVLTARRLRLSFGQRPISGPAINRLGAVVVLVQHLVQIAAFRLQRALSFRMMHEGRAQAMTGWLRFRGAERPKRMASLREEPGLCQLLRAWPGGRPARGAAPRRARRGCSLPAGCRKGQAHQAERPFAWATSFTSTHGPRPRGWAHGPLCRGIGLSPYPREGLPSGYAVRQLY